MQTDYSGIHLYCVLNNYIGTHFKSLTHVFNFFIKNYVNEHYIFHDFSMIFDFQIWLAINDHKINQPPYQTKFSYITQ